MKKQLTIHNMNQIEDYRNKILQLTNDKIGELLESKSGIDLLKEIKFNQNGFDPLFEEPMNFIEQINQTFTYLVSLEAAEKLLSLYPDKAFRLNLGTNPGYDIESEDGDIICECFASTSPDSNSKLMKDAERLAENKTASNKYVIFFSEHKKDSYVLKVSNKYNDVTVIPLDFLKLSL